MCGEVLIVEWFGYVVLIGSVVDGYVGVVKWFDFGDWVYRFG